MYLVDPRITTDPHGQRSKRMRSACSQNQLFLEHERSEHYKQHPHERRFESAFQNADSAFAN